MQSKEEKGGAERRRHRRQAIRAVGTVNYGRTMIPCIVTNLSRSGAQLRLLEDQPLPRELVKLEVRSLEKLITGGVVWQRGVFAGVKFAAEIVLSPSASAAAA